MTPQHKIGVKFIRKHSKRKDIETIIDILTTRNIKNEVIKIEYIASHDFLGQTITAKTMQSTIALSTIVK